MLNQHFFKPLLPGFHTHLTIPTTFFLKYIGEQKMAELRSDASKITWKVKIDGQRLTDGWKEFALSHDLRTGDIVVFRQEREMTFHVTVLGPSGCEIQYNSCLDYQNNLEKSQRKKSPCKEVESSSSVDPSCFVANVSPSSLRYDLMYLPRLLVKKIGVVSGSGKIVLMNEKGKSWTFTLKQKPLCKTVYFRGGWTSFCGANGLKAGDSITFKLIKRRGPLVLSLLPKELKEGHQEEEDNDVSFCTEPESHDKCNIGRIQRKNKTKSSLPDPSCLVVNITPSTLRYDRLGLPKSFVRKNDIDSRCGEMILMNQNGSSWSLIMRRKNSCGSIYIRRGWRRFCRVNGLRAGSIRTFKLIKKGRTLVLRLTPKEPKDEEEEDEEEYSEANEVESLSTDQESDEEISHDEKISHECSRRKEKKGRLTWTPSSSPSLNRFVTLTLTPYNMKYTALRLPAAFTRVNGINMETKLTLLDKNGFKWSTSLRVEAKKVERFRLLGGWKGFLEANCVKASESFLLELIWEEDKSCVLKFCSKVKL